MPNLGKEIILLIYSPPGETNLAWFERVRWSSLEGDYRQGLFELSAGNQKYLAFKEQIFVNLNPKIPRDSYTLPELPPRFCKIHAIELALN